MTLGSGVTTCRQDKFFQRRKFGIERIERDFQTARIVIGDFLITGYTQLPAQIEQVMLDIGQTGFDFFRQRISNDDADMAIEFIEYFVDNKDYIENLLPIS